MVLVMPMIVARFSKNDDEVESNDVRGDGDDRKNKEAVRESLSVGGAQEKAVGGAASKDISEQDRDPVRSEGIRHPQTYTPSLSISSLHP